MALVESFLVKLHNLLRYKVIPQSYCYDCNHTVDCNQHCTVSRVILNCPLFCNCPLLKDISFNTKCLLVWCD